jgi:trimeric autotransporter adhesin
MVHWLRSFVVRHVSVVMATLVVLQGLAGTTALPAQSAGLASPSQRLAAVSSAAHAWPQVYLRHLGPPTHTGPRIFLQPSQPLPVSWEGSPALTARFATGRVQPLALVTGDLTGDGVDDALAGYRLSRGGAIALYRGNLDAFAPRTHASFQAIGENRFPSPFLPAAHLLPVPFRPDLLTLGSFSPDGSLNLVAAARGGRSVYLFSRTHTGGFATTQTIHLPGAITALAAGKIGGTGASLLVGLARPGGQGPALEVYGVSGHRLTRRAGYALPGPASTILFGALGDPGQDAVLLAGGQVLILRSAPRRLVRISLPIQLVAMALGSFLFDRHPSPQLALLTRDGTLHLAVPRRFDPRPYTTTQWRVLRRATLTGSKASAAPAPPTFPSSWKLVQRVQAVARVAPGRRPLLLRSRLTNHGSDDLLVLDGSRQRLVVIAHPDPMAGATGLSRALVSILPNRGTPVAALAMRVNVDGRPGLLTLNRGTPAPLAMFPLPDPTYTVNRTDDPAPPSPITGACNGVANDCSIREAILRSTADAGPDTIMVPSGTFNLTRPKVSGDYSGRTGALYVNNSVNIVGAGQSSTFIQAGTTAYNAGTANGVDMVMAVNEDISPITNATASLSNLTIQNGNNQGTHSNDGDGGCMEFDTGSSGNANLTLTNVTLQNCQTNQGGGGGLVIFNFTTHGSGGVTITNGIIQGNSAVDNPSAGTGGGIAVAQDGHLSMSNSKVMNNKATQVTGTSQAGTGGGLIVFAAQDSSACPLQTTIHNSIISGNESAGPGGGMWNSASLLIDQGTVISGNSAGLGNVANAKDGGGLALNTFPSAIPTGCDNTTTLSNVTITGNSSTGNGGGIATGNNSGAGPLIMHFSRLAGNTAGTTAGNLYNNDSTATVTNNWWGTNSPTSTITSVHNSPGPSPATTFDPFIVLKTTASPSTINEGGSTTLTTSVLQDNHDTAIAVSNLAVLLGLPVSWTNAVHGSVSNQQTTIQSNGTATGTFTQDGQCATSSGEAEVDQVATGDATATASPTIQCPDLTATKTDSVSGVTQLVNGGSCPPQCWTWTITVSNTGVGFGSFSSGQTILSDNLPNSGVSYGTVTTTPVSGISGTISCSINGSDDLTCTASGAVQLAAGSSFTVSFAATPSAVTTFANPRVSGSCGVDPDGKVSESNEANNSCSDSVVVHAPDLTASNGSSSGTTPVLLGSSWTWTVTLANSSTTATAGFASGQTILSDGLPASHLSYGTPSVGSAVNITGSANVSCSLASATLTCSATGPVTIGTSGSLVVSVTATPDATGSYTNPPSGTACTVDPSNVVPESNEGNNDCTANTVSVVAPDLTLGLSHTGSSPVNFPTGWTWTISAANGGDGAATFASGQTILHDDLPGSGLTYGTVTIPAGSQSGISGTGSINCAIDGSQTLTCSASGGTVIIGATGGALVVNIPVTPTVAGSFTDPRSPGSCAIDPNSVITESDESNNACVADTVVVNDSTGPGAASLGVSPNPASSPPTFTAAIDDSSSGDSDIQAAEYFLDASGTPATGSGAAMAAQAGQSFGSAASTGVTATMSQAAYDALTGGTHTLSIRGEDSAGNWGSLASINFSIPAQTDPAGSSPTASPASIRSDGTTPSLLTIQVTKGLHPLSTGLAVTVDLSAIGGGASQQLYDDTTHGDVTAGDGTYSVSITVPEGTLPQLYSFPVTISDAQARSDSSQAISLTTTSPTLAVATIVSATSDGTQAQATTGGTGAFTAHSYTATAAGGISGKDSIEVATYSKDPVDGSAPSGGSGYFDVKLSPHNTFSAVTIVNCNLGSASPVVLSWYDHVAGSWQTISPLDTSTHAGCATISITGSSTPSLSQLVGTVFAANSGPTRALLSRVWVQRQGGRAIVHWRAAANTGIVGFYLTRGGQRLNRGLIPVHAARSYRYTVRTHHSGSIVVHAVLTGGKEATASG